MESPMDRDRGGQAVPRLGLRPVEAARSIGVSVSTLRRLTKAGEVACAKLAGVSIYSSQELQRWLTAKTELARGEQAASERGNPGTLEVAEASTYARRKGQHEDTESAD